MRATATTLFVAGTLAAGAAAARPAPPGQHYGAWFDAEDRAADPTPPELALINDFFTRFTATNQPCRRRTST
jgi:hypothetical protein